MYVCIGLKGPVLLNMQSSEAPFEWVPVHSKKTHVALLKTALQPQGKVIFYSRLCKTLRSRQPARPRATLADKLHAAHPQGPHAWICWNAWKGSCVLGSLMKVGKSSSWNSSIRKAPLGVAIWNRAELVCLWTCPPSLDLVRMTRSGPRHLANVEIWRDRAVFWVVLLICQLLWLLFFPPFNCIIPLKKTVVSEKLCMPLEFVFLISASVYNNAQSLIMLTSFFCCCWFSPPSIHVSWLIWSSEFAVPSSSFQIFILTFFVHVSVVMSLSEPTF